MRRLKTMWRGALLASLVAFAGCIATETGNPSLGPEIDPADIEGDIPPDDPTAPSIVTITVSGGPGAIDPPEGVVLGWGVEGPGPHSTANVADDGSFRLFVPAEPDELIRIVARAPDGALSRPYDLRVGADDVLRPAEPAHACLTLEPEVARIDARVGAEVRVDVVNGCDYAITRQPARLRDPNSALTLIDDGAFTVAPGGSGTIVARVDEARTTDDIVLIEIDAPEPELRAVSIFVE